MSGQRRRRSFSSRRHELAERHARSELEGAYRHVHSWSSPDVAGVRHCLDVACRARLGEGDVTT